MRELARFLEILRTGPPKPDCIFNPWRDWDERDRAPRRLAPGQRLKNLGAYLDARRSSARVMLVGEAPSHRGCRFTGIAFCSETELIHKHGSVARKRLTLTSRDAHVKPQRERSAAVIWDEIDRAGVPFEVLLWNAFPWHPYLAEGAGGRCGVASNRRPRTTEVEHGRGALVALLACFTHPIEIFAVGKVAEDALARWEELRCAGYIRHPSQGGEALFREGFRRLVASRL